MANSANASPTIQTDKSQSANNTLDSEKAISTAAAAGLFSTSKKERPLPAPCGESEKIGRAHV